MTRSKVKIRRLIVSFRMFNVRLAPATSAIEVPLMLGALGELEIGSPWTSPPEMMADVAEERFPDPAARSPCVINVLIVPLLKARVFLTVTVVPDTVVTTAVDSSISRVVLKPVGQGSRQLPSK